ncbi:MAG: PilZ domain-containing protein [Pseudomonadota bacterium]
MKEKGIETSGLDKNKITRQVFRLPVDEKVKVTIKINGTPFEVINIGANGVGLLVDNDAPFAVDQVLSSIELNIDNDLLKLKGRVLHVSPHDFQLICGIEFVKPSKTNADKICQFLHSHRENLFVEV